jgi:hypothetical protein
MTWAGIEVMIDALIEWYHPIRGRTDIQEEYPVTFDRKMDYLNKMARDPGFGESANNLRLMRTEAKRLTNWRKAIVHGLIIHQKPQGLEWVVSVRRFTNGNKATHVEHLRTTDADLREILSQMARFSALISPWIAKLTGITK